MKKIIFALLFASSFIATAQEEEKKFTLSGTVDTYFRANLNAPNAVDDDNSPLAAPGSSFANLPGFSLGMINVIAGYEGEKSGFVADLVFGPRGTDAVFASPMYSATGNIVNQLYAYWNVSEKVTLTIGNFNTFLGYEVISPAANFNYSTSYLFSYGPFSHSGIKADFSLGEDSSLMLAILNPTDATEFNPDGKYSIGAQYGVSGQYFNFLLNPDSYEIDFTGGFDLSDSFFLGLNAAYFDADDAAGFYGVALYPQLSTSDSFSIGLRAEYFAETNGEFGAIGTGIEESSVFATTLSANYSIGSLTIIPEIRLDSSSDDFFLNNDSEMASGLSSFVLAAVYSF
ncbi:outer membrane beta-barrel protein [Polaribacter sargassicola]|uniref:outer membrane beta-barrel protein n=1 Tax=Polaribacter sargassicola TaxID=2836891 RepID=UPI001F37C4B4|nr:outer membrane beta-barrel protein [Polaribacter sp. DS7-9]MCG1037797.1 outer membrane beta-barrel protein [Polaribacter sp. DS7-9]